VGARGRRPLRLRGDRPRRPQRGMADRLEEPARGLRPGGGRADPGAVSRGRHAAERAHARRLPRARRRSPRGLERLSAHQRPNPGGAGAASVPGAARPPDRRRLAARRGTGRARERPRARVGVRRGLRARRLGARDHQPRLARAQGAAGRPGGRRHRRQQLGPRSIRPASRAQPRAVPEGGGGAGRLTLRRPRVAPDRRVRRGRPAAALRPRPRTARRPRASDPAGPDPGRSGPGRGSDRGGARAPQPRARGAPREQDRGGRQRDAERGARPRRGADRARGGPGSPRDLRRHP
jgi:hypothetical protein